MACNPINIQKNHQNFEKCVLIASDTERLRFWTKKKCSFHERNLETTERRKVVCLYHSVIVEMRGPLKCLRVLLDNIFVSIANTHTHKYTASISSSSSSNHSATHLCLQHCIESLCNSYETIRISWFVVRQSFNLICYK